MTATEPWLTRKDGAEKVAAHRLAEIGQRITQAVNTFRDDASTEVEQLDAPSHEGLGTALFTAVTDVLTVAFAADQVIERGAGEAIAAFRDVTIAGITAAARQSSETTLAHANDQLRHVLTDLAVATGQSTTAGWEVAGARLAGSFTAFLGAHPEHLPADVEAGASAWEGWLCDQIGIRDAAEADPSPHLNHVLWEVLHKDCYRVSAQRKWHGLTLSERLEFLQEMQVDQREPYLRLLGVRRIQGWHEALELYTDATARLEPSFVAAVGALVDE